MPNVHRNKIDAERQMTAINSQILERSPENDLFDDTKGGILISPEVGGREAEVHGRGQKTKGDRYPSRYICFPLSLADVLIKLATLIRCVVGL